MYMWQKMDRYTIRAETVVILALRYLVYPRLPLRVAIVTFPLADYVEMKVIIMERYMPANMAMLIITVVDVVD